MKEICPNCGDEIILPLSKIYNEQRFCGTHCIRDFLSKKKESQDEKNLSTHNPSE
jgi:transposase-like protein